MMSSVSPHQPIGKLVNPGQSGTFYGLGPSSVITTTNNRETVSSPLTVNCIGVNLSPSSPTTSSSSSLSLSSTIATTSTTTTTISTNSVVNLINCSTPLPSIQSSPSSTIDSGNSSNTINYGLNGKGKSNGKDLVKANVPYFWRREKINGTIVYISPSNCFLWSHQDISVYLLTDGTCKCGLACPIILEELFNFDPKSPSISLTPVNNQTNNCNKLDKEKSLNCKTSEDHTFSENHFHNNNPINDEYPPKTCNHRRRNLIEISDDSSNHHHNHHINSNSNDNFSTTNTLTTNTTTNITTTTTVNDTRNQTNVRLTHQTSPIPEATNQSLQQQHFTNTNHVYHSPTFHQHHQQQQQQPQQQLTANSIPFYRSNHQQSIINPGVTIFKSDANFNLTQDKEEAPLLQSNASSSYTSDPNHPTNISKDYQHHSNPPSLTANSYINWLPLNASDDNRLTAIVNENQSNVQAFANTSTSSLPGFADVISGMSLTPTLISPHNPGGSQLVQLYNPVQYTSVPPNAVALLSPAQNLNRDGSATILIPSLMQSTDHLHHHHHHQQQPIVLNSTENVSTTLDHQTRNLLPSLRPTTFSSIPLQTPYTFQPQLADTYLAASPSPTQSHSVTPTSITNNSVSNDTSSDNNSNLTRSKFKSKAKTKLIKRRSPRNRKAKENNNQRLNQPLTVDCYINQNQEEPEKLINQVIDDEKETVDESSSRLRLIDHDHLMDDFDDDDDTEEPMDSQDCDYEESRFQSEDDKGDFEYERIDDSAQCTSEDIMRELSSQQQNSTIRNIGVQSDELIDGEPESPVDKRVQSTDCSDDQMVYSSNQNNHQEEMKIVTEETEEDEEEEDEDVEEEEEREAAVEDEEEGNDDVDYSIHSSNFPDNSEGSSEKDDKINNIKSTCQFILKDDQVNDVDSFNDELDDNVNNYHHTDEDNGDNGEDEFEIDGNTNDNDLLSSDDDLSVNFVHSHSDNNNNISINGDINSFEDEDEQEDDFNGEDNYDNQNILISMSTTMTTTTTITSLITKQSSVTHEPDAVNDNNCVNEEADKEEEEEDEADEDDDNTGIITTFIDPPSTNENPADEGLFGRLSNNIKATTTPTPTPPSITATVKDDSTKNRNNKRLERLRKELLCYENNFDQTTAQSPPLSPQVRSFETGDLVWGQNKGNPSWPGKLVSKDDGPGTNNGLAERGKVWVKWFGDNLVTQVELDKLKTLSEGLEAHHTARKKHRKGKKTDSCLDQAIQEAMNELDKQIDQQPLSSTKSHPQTTLSPSPSSSSPQPPSSS